MAQGLSFLLDAPLRAARAERRAARLAFANRAAARLAAVAKEAELHHSLLRELGEIIPYDTAALYLLCQDSTQLRVAATRGFASGRQRWMDKTANERLLGVVVRSRQPLLIGDAWGDLAAWPTSPEMAPRASIRGMLYVPVLSAGEALGVIGLGRREPYTFDAEDLEVATLMANHAGVAIANARHHHHVHRELESKLRDLANLSRISQSIGASLQTETVLQNVVLGTAEAFKPSISAIVLLEEQRNELVVAAISDFDPKQMGRRFQVEGSASGWVIRHGEPLFVPWTPVVPFEPLKEWFSHEGIKSWIGVPLIIHGRPVGSLNVYSRTGRSYEPGDLELLRGLAAQAAIAIEHAGLYQSVSREKAKLEAIVESLDEGLLLVGSNGETVYASRRFEDLLGLCGEPLEGTSLSRIWGVLASRSDAPDETRARLDSLEPSSLQPILLTLTRPRRQDLELHCFNVQASGCDLSGRGYVVRDVTQKSEIERLKVGMLSTVSHELRTPLAVIKGFATSLLRTDVEWDEASKRDFVEQIDRECDRLSTMVRNLLDMSRLEAGTLSLDREWCDMTDLVTDIVTRISPIVGGHQVRVATEGGGVFAFVDRRYIERVVLNLIENAAKYSECGSAITIGVARDGRAVLLTVQDQGVGIKHEERDRIFERFYRGAGVRSTAGVGLGLAICKGIVEAHGGSMSVESKLGHGSTFTVRLPDHPMDGLAHAAPPPRL